MSASDDDVSTGLGLAITEDMSPGEAVVAVLSAITLSVGIVMTNLLEALGQQIANVFESLQALRAFIEAFFEQPIVIMTAGAADTAQWITTTDLGPFGFLVSVVIIAAAFWIWAGAGAPVPFFGNLTQRLR